MNKYSDLTKAEKKLVSNGCGAKKFIKPPKVKEFEASCDHHDYLYLKGGQLLHKARADVLFLAHLLKDCAKLDSVLTMILFISLAVFYFVMVSLFGHFFFNYTKKQLTNKQILNKLKEG